MMFPPGIVCLLEALRSQFRTTLTTVSTLFFAPLGLTFANADPFFYEFPCGYEIAEY